jgi:DNA-binding MarR family transcriptional regulator
MTPTGAEARAGGRLDLLGFLLARHGAIAGHRIQQAIGALGLGPRHSTVLLHLEAGPVSQQSLVEALGIDPSLVVAVLNDLERDRLALRRRDSCDRRRHIVELTPSGEATIEAIGRAVDAVERELFADLGPDDLARLRGLLNRLRADPRGACAAAEPAALPVDRLTLPVD